MHAGLLAVVCGLIAVVRRGSWTGWLRTAGWGAIVYGLPGAVVAGASGRVAGLTEELVFLLLPVVVVFAVAQTGGFGAGEDQRRLLGPALAGIAGAALLVPFTLPASLAGDGWLAALVVSVGLSGWAAVQLHGWLRGRGLWAASAAVAAGWALLAAVGPGWRLVGQAGARDWGTEAAEALLLDGPTLVLGVWCVRELAPIRYSARALLVLLIAIAESAAAAQPRVTWTMAAGAALMVAGAGWLLRDGGQAAE